ncbi:MAG: alpha/beta fold hydrolase [Candidatus Taylorbacteria bacterium]|nr:alpha/beta fold hydrolase [Candidatus Taylorbacteria bacterium]
MSLFKKIFRGISWTVVALILLVCLILAFFDIMRHFRENDAASAVAPATGHFVKAADADVFVQEAGPSDGPAVVLIHGTGSWGEIWRDTIDPLAKEGYHVIAIDFTPFGYSMKFTEAADYTLRKQAARIVGIFTAMRIEHATLVAHSIGSRPAVEAVLENPNLVDKLILVAPALGYPKSAEAAFEFQQNNPSFLVGFIFGHPGVRNTIISTYGTNPLFIKRIFSSFVFDKKSITDARTNVIKQPMSVKKTTEAYGAWLQNLLTAQDDSLASDFNNLKKLSMPVDLIWGDKDAVTPLWAGKKLQALLLHSEMTVIPNVGHMPYLENVGDFNKALLYYLKK